MGYLEVNRMRSCLLALQQTLSQTQRSKLENANDVESETLVELGFDSLSLVEFAVALESNFGISVNLSDFVIGPLTSVRDLFVACGTTGGAGR